MERAERIQWLRWVHCGDPMEQGARPRTHSGGGDGDPDAWQKEEEEPQGRRRRRRQIGLTARRVRVLYIYVRRDAIGLTQCRLCSFQEAIILRLTHTPTCQCMGGAHRSAPHIVQPRPPRSDVVRHSVLKKKSTALQTSRYNGKRQWSVRSRNPTCVPCHK